MGVSFSNLIEPHNHSHVQSTSANHHHNNNAQTCVPLYPAIPSNSKLEIVPTCDHDMLHNYRDMTMSPRFMARGGPQFGGGLGPQRRSRFGYDGWGGGPDFGHGDRPDALCGYCGGRAHPGPCDDGGHRGGGGGGGAWSRPRYMRGGGGSGDMEGGIAAGLHNLSAALNNGMATRGGGCGPSCSANDGGLRVRGNVGDHDIDLKLGGKQKCPCDEDGGCEVSHKRVKSRSRSRKRRERRGRRKTRRRDRDMDEDSSDGEQSRGRPRERVPLRGGDGSIPDLQPRVERLETDVEKLNNGWVWVKSRIPDLPPPFPARPDLGLPDGTPFEMPPPYGLGRPDFGGMPMRPPGLRRRMRTMGDLSDIDELGMPPRPGMGRLPAGFGRMPNRPVDGDMDPLLDGPDFGLRGAFGARRGRPPQAMDREDDLGVGDLAGFEDVEEDLPMRFQRGMSLRGPRGLRARPRGLGGRRGGGAGLRAAAATREDAERRRDEEMFGGLRAPGENDDANWELPRRQSFAARSSFPFQAAATQDKMANGRKARADSAQDSPRLGERNQSRQSGALGEKPSSP